MLVKRLSWAFLGLVGVIALVGTALAQGEGDAKMAWKAFDTKGQTFYQELETNTVQNMKVQGVDVQQDQKQTFLIAWTPLDKDKDGRYVVEQQIIGVKMDIDIGGNKMRYDSTEATIPSNPLTDFFKALEGSKLTLTIDPKDMSVVNIEGRNDFIKKLGGSSPQMDKLLQNILSDAALKQMAEPTWGALPTKAVKKGDTWDRSTSMDLGPIGKYETKSKYTLDTVDAKQGKIDITTTVTYQPPVAGAGAKKELPFTIKSAELASKDGTGTALFNVEKGRFDQITTKMKISGKLVIDVSNMDTEVALDQTQSSVSKTSETKPATWEKKKAG